MPWQKNDYLTLLLIISILLIATFLALQGLGITLGGFPGGTFRFQQP